MRRSDQRRDAVFASYQRDVTGRPLAELLADAKPFTRELAEGVDADRAELDETIAEYAKGWTVDRIAPLDRTSCGSRCTRSKTGETPVEVAIDEAVEIAKEYCGADAPGFVNGILGAIVREREPASELSRLREIAERLRRSPPSSRATELGDERAAELAAEAAELAAEAVEEANRQAREAASAG